MAPFDLTVVDEAHGTAGDLGRPRAAIHDQSRIPADFRLYLMGIAGDKPALVRPEPKVPLSWAPSWTINRG
ncbi:MULTISPECIES: hypothetical protein [Streptomyces]|uniref:hypothetical protein n=1 Tax=Streptomyces TaxID=1883 RepID=UPI00361BA639